MTVLLCPVGVFQPFNVLRVGDLFFLPAKDGDYLPRQLYVKVSDTTYRVPNRAFQPEQIGIGLAVQAVKPLPDNFYVIEYAVRPSRAFGKEVQEAMAEIHRAPRCEMPDWVQDIYGPAPAPRPAVTKAQRSRWRWRLMDRLFNRKN